MTTRRWSSFIYFIIAITLLIATCMPISRVYTYAADLPILDQIRVSLFIDTRGTVPAVTISSGGQMSIGIRKPGGVEDWMVTSPSVPVRFSLSDYGLRITDTTDYNMAVAAFDRVAMMGEAAIYAVSGPGKMIYQVRLGGFRSLEEAGAARMRIPADLRTANNDTDIVGPYYASAGSFASLEEAENRQAALATNHITAYVAIHPGDTGAIVYSLWIGEAASTEALRQAVSDATNNFPGLATQAVNADMPFLLKRSDATASGSGGNLVRYQFNSRNQNVWLSASAGADMKVTERFGRSYRGNIEITANNNKLAVINQLPLEHYLYSVVGSELGSAWPMEALKAQVVAARTFALSGGMKYKIAHISDTTYDQAYKGKGAEFPAGNEAVESTRSEVIVDQGGNLIVPSYSSNSGGMTADTSEAWLTPITYLKPVPSPDQDAASSKPVWYRIMLADGSSGYISSDYARLMDRKNEAGLPLVEVTGTNVNVRKAPYVDNTSNPAIAQVSVGQSFVWIGQEIESNAYNWVRGPYGSEVLKSTINARSSRPVIGDLLTLDINSRGPSDRVIGMKANNQELAFANPDMIRSALNGLPSTKFEVEQTGRYSILGARDAKREFPESAGPLSTINKQGASELGQSEFYVLNGAGDVRAVTVDPQFRFIGLGFGHGVGLSQYGAKSLAERGYDYQSILKHYYYGVSIIKG